MITKSQRGLFFVFVNNLGRDRVYTILEQVTKGITSLRDPFITPWKMSWVLFELISRYPDALQSRDREKVVKKGNNVIQLISGDERRAIETLLKIARLSEHEYIVFCQRNIGRNAPCSHDDAIVIMKELQKIISIKKVNRCLYK
jgi:hypothetical protein